MARCLRFGLLPLCTFLLGFVVLEGPEGRSDGRGRNSPLTDTDKNYTTVGNIGFTITNFGTIGTRNAYWPSQPSCEYPRGSRIEHLYQGGVWVGAQSKRTGQIHVSTGSSDQVSTTTGKGLEFTSDPETDLVQRSTLPESQFFSESAVSHQDFVAFYNDLVPRDSSAPDQSVPLGIEVRQESYAWNFPFADFFVILNYTIHNVSQADTLDSLYVGLWTNTVVRNTNNVRPSTPGYFSHGANGYSDSLRMQYTFDFDGIPAPPAANSYVGVKLLGSTPFPHGTDSVGNLNRHTYYNAWKYQSSSGDAAYFSPSDDAGTINGARSRYDRLSESMPQSSIDALRIRADNMTTLLSTGPFGPLAPGDSLTIAFGVICARKFGNAPASLDTREQRKTLNANAILCQQAYEGEDSNGNDQLDPGEDVNGNGKLDHYLLPQPLFQVADTQYVQIFPTLGSFVGPRGILLGRDQLLYVADSGGNTLTMMNLAGQVLSSRSIPHPVSIAQDSRLDLLVGGETDLGGGSTAGALFRIHLVSTDPDSAHRLNLARVDTVWTERARPLRRFPGITVLGDNTYLVARCGPDNSSFIDPDGRILEFDASDHFITSMPGLVTRSGSGITDINIPTGITSFPGIRDFILTQSSEGIAYGAIWMTYQHNADFDG